MVTQATLMMPQVLSASWIRRTPDSLRKCESAAPSVVALANYGDSEDSGCYPVGGRRRNDRPVGRAWRVRLEGSDTLSRRRGLSYPPYRLQTVALIRR